MKNRVKSDICPNCEAHLTQREDNFCGNCGQENHTYKLPLSYFVKELVETFTNFDTKTITTLRDLLFSPGLLTKNFNNNKRARYVPPVRLYLVTSAVFFSFSILATKVTLFNKAIKSKQRLCKAMEKDKFRFSRRLDLLANNSINSWRWKIQLLNR